MELAQKLLYSNTFCAYRDRTHGHYICIHPYSYGTCDLDYCPIYNEYFANIIFDYDRKTNKATVYLVVKRPSEKYVAGEWSKIELNVSPELDNIDELFQIIDQNTEGVPPHIVSATKQKLRNIFKRWEFLKMRQKPIGVLGVGVAPSEAAPTEELEVTEELEKELSEELEKLEE